MNLLGIDFEDWYHPHLVESFVPKEKRIPSMHKGLDKILDLLRKNDTKATFFLVGELLESNPEIIDKINSEKHEIAFHTMSHTRLDSPYFKTTFKEELSKFKKIVSGKSVGFRAPTFSLNKNSSWVIDELIANNYKYDSSVIPTKTSMYGIPDAPITPYKISSSNLIKNNENSPLLEFPLLITKYFGKSFPGGGFYLRFLPLRVFRNSLKKYEKENIPGSFYIHSWELTPEYIPKIQLPFKNRFITFHKIEKTFSKMDRLLKEFEFSSFNSYLK